MRVDEKYSAEFKADALAMMERGDRTKRQLAQDLGLHPWNLRDWYNAAQMAKKKGKRPEQAPVALVAAAETPQQRIERLERENARLRKQNEQLQEDRLILKKAAAFFARENE